MIDVEGHAAQCRADCEEKQFTVRRKERKAGRKRSDAKKKKVAGTTAGFGRLKLMKQYREQRAMRSKIGKPKKKGYKKETGDAKKKQKGRRTMRFGRLCEEEQVLKGQISLRTDRQEKQHK